MNGLYDEIRAGAARDLDAPLAGAGGGLGHLRCSAGWSSAQMPNRYEAKARVFVQMRPVLPAQGRHQRAGTAERRRHDPPDADQRGQSGKGRARHRPRQHGRERPRRRRSRRRAADRRSRSSRSRTICSRSPRRAVEPQAARSRSSQKLIDIFVEQNLSDDRNETQPVAALPRRAARAAAEAAGRRRGQARGRSRTAISARCPAPARSQRPHVGARARRWRRSTAISPRAQIQPGRGQRPDGGHARRTSPASAAAASSAARRARASPRSRASSPMRAAKRLYRQPSRRGRAARASSPPRAAAASSEPIGAGGGGHAAQPALSVAPVDAGRQAGRRSPRSARARRSCRATSTAIMAKLAGDPAVAAEQGQIDRDYQVLKDQYDKLLGDREQIASARPGADADRLRSSSA